MRSLVAAVALGVAALAAFAQGVLPVPALTGRVIDQTATLTPQQADALSAKLASIETAHGAQLVVLIVPTTAPEDVASFAQRVGEQWKIGRRDVGDGLLIVVAKNDRAVQIQVAKALQGAVPDIAAGRIISQQIVPAFRAGDYAGGLNSAVDRLGERIASEGLPAPVPQAGERRSRPSGGFDFQSIALFLFIGVPILGGILSRIMGRKLGALATGAAVGTIGWFLTASLLIAAGAGVVALFLVGVMGVGGSRGGGLGGMGGGPIIWGGGGGGGFGGGGGGGFSSGGGGSFDGGGASGRW
ncbi:MAG: TPM domain-containing protein [Caldimonas sp.]